LAIHPTAVIDRRAEIDGNVEVGPFCVIEGHVRVAAGCRLYQHVYLTGWTQIGESCVLHPGVIVGHEPQDTKYRGERSYCRIGARTILREYVTIHRGTIPDSETVVGDDCFLLAGGHVAHNCTIGSGVTLINNVLLGGHVRVDDRATLGGGAGIHQFVRIGELAMIAGTARVVMDVPPFALIDTEGRVAGLNRIGLRRAGMSHEDLRDVREAYRVLYASGLSFTEAVERLAGGGSCSAARQRLVRFLQANSRRGVAGRSRPKGKRSEPVDGRE
jgi:UDP-N-acetylglucosamine acyltransferase